MLLNSVANDEDLGVLFLKKKQFYASNIFLVWSSKVKLYNYYACLKKNTSNRELYDLQFNKQF